MPSGPIVPTRSSSSASVHGEKPQWLAKDRLNVSVNCRTRWSSATFDNGTMSKPARSALSRALCQRRRRSGVTSTL